MYTSSFTSTLGMFTVRKGTYIIKSLRGRPSLNDLMMYIPLRVSVLAMSSLVMELKLIDVV